MTTLIISILTIAFLLISIIFFPNLKIKKLTIQTFWIIPLLGVIFLFIFKQISFTYIKDILFRDNSINPIKILILFLSISFLSIVLDEAGFFKKCAIYAIQKNNSNQKKLFFAISLIVSCLTIFTSNDIIILTFTPFICYFCKHAKINPIPYLISEFVLANTWSMMLIIGNPTNIYLAESFDISFFKYLSIMFFPTLLVSILASFFIYLIFKNQLSQKLVIENKINVIKTNNFLMLISLIHLGLCTIFLSISSYTNFEMWIISLFFAISLLLFTISYSLLKHDKILISSIKRVPYNLIPFILSMFIIISSLTNNGITKIFAHFLGNVSNNSTSTIFVYGISAFIACNILNNIPMSVFYEQIISLSSNTFIYEKIFSTIIASNIGAYLTPIGALAGIMWMSVLKNSGVKFNFLSFIKYGFLIAPLLIIVALSLLSIVL